MSLFEKTSDGIGINDSSFHEKHMIEKYISMINEQGIDFLPITYGVDPSPDFGYFDLADRYWRTSLCIYMAGIVRCFWESGVGFTEPWLFNVRHSFELKLKGLKLFSVWLEAVNQNIDTSGYVSSIEQLRRNFSNVHSLSSLYNDFSDSIKIAINNWSNEFSDEPPSLNEFFLNHQNKTILDELDEADPSSFSFRYPSIKNGQTDEIQKLGWKHDPNQLFPQSGLPKRAGYFFDHIKTVNSLHGLNTELTRIVNLSNSIWDYIGEMQRYI